MSGTAQSRAGRAPRRTPVTREQAERIVSATGWLAHVHAALRVAVLARCSLLRFAPGQPVFRYADPPGGIYGLVAGTVTANGAPPGSTPRLVNIGTPGAWTGEGCFITGQARRGEIRALSETRMMHLPLDAMEQIAAQDPRAVRAFCLIAIFTFDTMLRIVHDLQKRHASRRIAAVLQRSASTSPISLALSQSDLGVMANASRQQVNAAMQRFASAGWVRCTYRSMTILDPVALRAYAEHDGAA